MKVEEEKFPAGLRVLVVDDDPTCLKVMEGLLQKCQYKVTTCNQGKEALKMLRKNKKAFDIIICDVCMPEIDGLKLLQVLAFDMNLDLPVIMLSAFSDQKLVMSGIKLGACDYLVKPVRIQELQNIWQHVVRKNNSLTSRRPRPSSNGGEREVPSTTSNAIQERRPDEIRAEEQENTGSGGDDFDGQDMEENSNENEDEPTAQKKPRLFWSPELHKKFVDAVNHLGFDKAFPKKILEEMNVEGLTREHVASHLQKYRMYLKKMNTPSSEQASGSSSLVTEDVHMSSLGGGYGVNRTLAGSGPYLSPTRTSSFPQQPALGLLGRQQGGRLGQFPGPSGLGPRPITTPSQMFQRPQLLNSTTRLMNHGMIMAPTGFQRGNINHTFFQGGPAPIPQNRPLSIGPSTSNTILNGNSSLQMNTSTIGNQSSPFYCNSSNIGVASQPPSSQPSLQHRPFSSFVSGDAISPATTPIDPDELEYFCGISSLEESNKGDNTSPASLTAVNSFTNQGQSQNWQGNNRSDFILNSTLPTIPNTMARASGQSNQTFNQTNNSMNSLVFNQIEGVTSNFSQQNEIHKSNGNSSPNFGENFLLEDSRLLGSSSQNSSETLEDIVGRFLKQGNGDIESADENDGMRSFADY